MLSVPELLVTLLTSAVVEGLRVTEVDVPRYLVVGQKARLRCHFALEGEVLYSLKWWKDGSQFYQFIPRNDPKMVVFTVAGVTVNTDHSDLHEVELVDVQASSSGSYRCEVVGEAPTFNTHILAANMTIVDPPDGPPVVRGLATTYSEGDLILLNCTSYRSRPPPELFWSVERFLTQTSGERVTHFVKADETELLRYRTTPSWPQDPSEPPPPLSKQTYSATLGLRLQVQRRLAPHGVFKLRCRSVVHEYEWATEVIVKVEATPLGEPHHLPTLLNTGAAVKACASITRCWGSVSTCAVITVLSLYFLCSP